MSGSTLRYGVLSILVIGIIMAGILALPAIFGEKTTIQTTGYAQYVAGDNLSTDQLTQLNIDVRLLIADKCYKCHNSTKHKAALILDTKEGIFEGGENGAVISPGNSAESEMIRRLRLPSRNEDAMPPEGDRLSKDEINLLALWIDEGAYWADTTLKLFPEASLHLVKPVLPDKKQGLENPVDLLVDDYFAQQKTNWPKLIDDQQFIRKVYLDITGLLPSPQAILEFIENNHPDKYNLLVDNLLADEKNYTLNWLSFWNDLLRNDYTGTGFITKGRKQITDWLYCALYDNIPYDKIVEELINPREESEGFIAGIQWRGVVNASQRIELQAAQNISQSLLGLNLKCASCHNSFVNNVSLAQAYSFANVFADTTLEIYQCDKATGVLTSTEFIFPELGPVVGDSLDDRLASLAEIMVKPENGRLYRTMVNRIWDRLFGRGLIASVDDMDQLPWSHEILDWLAADFIDQGFDLKILLKTILTSKTYRLRPVMFSSPDELNKKDYIFKGPVPRRISAEQFVDAFSQNIYPFYHGVQFTQQKPVGNPNWIWHREIEVDREVLPKPGVRWFRKKFNLKNPEIIERAELIISVDSSFRLFLNDQEIIQGNDWRQVVKTTINNTMLKEDNCIAIEAINDGLIANPAGILMTLKITYPEEDLFIISNKSWASTDTMPENDWKKYSFIDTTWKEARSYGEKGVWGYLVNFNFENTATETPRASLIALDRFTLALGRPTRENVTTKRNDEATLLQAMMLSNDDMLAENIKRGAAIWKDAPGDDEVKISKIFFQLLGRNPQKEELEILLNLIGPDNYQEAWEDVIWSLLMLPEFHLI